MNNPIGAFAIIRQGDREIVGRMSGTVTRGWPHGHNTGDGVSRFFAGLPLDRGQRRPKVDRQRDRAGINAPISLR